MALNPSTTDKLITADQYLDAAAYRHSVYGLNNQPPVSDARIQEIAQKVLKVTPSSYNTQTSRIALVLGDKSQQYWQELKGIVVPFLDKVADPEVSQKFEGLLGAFAAAYGTAIFFEDGKALAEAQEKHKSTAQALPQFTEHTSAMHQIHFWDAIELEGFGANLQHTYAIPGVQEATRKFLNLPEEWDVKAQLVFGGKAQPHPNAKDKLPYETTLKIFK